MISTKYLTIYSINNAVIPQQPNPQSPNPQEETEYTSSTYSIPKSILESPTLPPPKNSLYTQNAPLNRQKPSETPYDPSNLQNSRNNREIILMKTTNQPPKALEITGDSYSSSSNYSSDTYEFDMDTTSPPQKTNRTMVLNNMMVAVQKQNSLDTSRTLQEQGKR